jgi:hypothetical protein
MQLFNTVNYLRFGKAKASTKLPPSNIENACQTDPLPELLRESDNQTDSMSLTSSKWDEFCKKYDQWPKDLPSNVHLPSSTSAIRTMYADNLQYNTAKLHQHHWTLFNKIEEKGSCEYPTLRSIQDDANTTQWPPLNSGTKSSMVSNSTVSRAYFNLNKEK